MWLDRTKLDNKSYPEKYDKYNEYHDQWIKLHPNCNFKFWNRRKAEELWSRNELSKWNHLYSKVQRHIEKCDITRYALLFSEPGINIYKDLDILCNKSLVPLVTSRPFGWTYESEKHLDPVIDKSRRISNSIMFAESKFWLLPLILDYIDENYSSYQSVLENTGPTMLARFSKKYNLELTHPEFFVSPCLLLPLDNTNSILAECSKDALKECYTYTKWNEGTGWGSEDTKFYSYCNWFVNSQTAILIVTFILLLCILVYK